MSHYEAGKFSESVAIMGSLVGAMGPGYRTHGERYRQEKKRGVYIKVISHKCVHTSHLT